MEGAEERYRDWIDMVDMQELKADELDYSILDRHITVLTQLARVSNSGITVFDMNKKRHVFTSYNFPEIFGYDMQQIEEQDVEYFSRHIHPDDIDALNRNGVTVLKYFCQGSHDPDELARMKMISEYRILMGEKYVRVIEQFQILEFDPAGNVWLSLSVMDVSPNQTVLQSVQSKVMNCKTGELFYLSEFTGTNEGHLLSPREKKILELVRNGLLSKEISEQLAISVHTVNTHRQRILEKLNADNSMEAVQYASRLGLLD